MLVVPLFYFLMVPALCSTLLSPFPLEDTWTTLVLVATAQNSATVDALPNPWAIFRGKPRIIHPNEPRRRSAYSWLDHWVNARRDRLGTPQKSDAAGPSDGINGSKICAL